MKPLAAGAICAAIPATVILGLLIILPVASPAVPATSEGSATCSTNWKTCVDNADLANNNSVFNIKAGLACKRAADDMAKYGKGEWPWDSFGTFLKGDDYPKTGIVTLIERDAGFKNGFNATVRSRVVCTYDLNTKQVVDVQISDRMPETTYQVKPKPPQPEPAAAPDPEKKAFDSLASHLEKNPAVTDPPKAADGSKRRATQVCGPDHWQRDHWEPSCR
jgi:hypothetical protein